MSVADSRPGISFFLFYPDGWALSERSGWQELGGEADGSNLKIVTEAEPSSDDPDGPL